MNLKTFLQHHGLQENPFAGEEARLDPVFSRLIDEGAFHPDFPKIMGQIDNPSTAVVFGEKGAGKTAIRLQIEKQIDEHNQKHPDRKVLVVPYDDLNPVLDRLLRVHRQNADRVLASFRLDDHQDAILSQAVSRVADGMLNVGDDDDAPMPDDFDQRIRKNISKQQRLDFATLAALYDQPRSGSVVERFARLRRKLRVGTAMFTSALLYGAVVVTVVALGLLAAWAGWGLVSQQDEPAWLVPVLGVVGAAAVALWVFWIYRTLSLWWLSRKIRRETPTINRSESELRAMLAQLPGSDLSRQPVPTPHKDAQAETDQRYQLTRKLVDFLRRLGYAGLVVLIDRIDEPTLVHGDADRMKAILWPMFDNKFLKQDAVGVKMLLPIELRHMLRKESATFFQEARLDKQNMVDRLSWSGATLYDLCSARLKACATEDGQKSLTDLFTDDVTRDTLIDALDQMHQPRDAFKFLYATIQEHCRGVPEDAQQFQIPRLTLESVRKDQAQRVQEFYRGLAPA